MRQAVIKKTLIVTAVVSLACVGVMLLPGAPRLLNSFAALVPILGIAWIVVLLVAGGFAMRAELRKRERLMRWLHGHCLTCGYDLRRSRGRCPECGRRIAAEPFERFIAGGGEEAIRTGPGFFSGKDPVHFTLFRMAATLDYLRIPYAIIGGLALNAHGYRRATNGVDMVISEDGLCLLESQQMQLELCPGQVHRAMFIDCDSGVAVRFYLSDTSPGRDDSWHIRFPDPADHSVRWRGVRYAPLSTLFNLKLASGMMNPARLKDLSDAQQLIRALKLPASFAERLDPYVRRKFEELRMGIEQDVSGLNRD